MPPRSSSSCYLPLPDHPERDPLAVVSERIRLARSAASRSTRLFNPLCVVGVFTGVGVGAAFTVVTIAAAAAARSNFFFASLIPMAGSSFSHPRRSVRGTGDVITGASTSISPSRKLLQDNVVKNFL